jgi:hypothetical protein
VVDVAFHEECKKYPLGTRGTLPPILASMNNGAGKATNQSGFNALLVWEKKPAEKLPFPDDIGSQSTPDGTT